MRDLLYVTAAYLAAALIAIAVSSSASAASLECLTPEHLAEGITKDKTTNLGSIIVKKDLTGKRLERFMVIAEKIIGAYEEGGGEVDVPQLPEMDRVLLFRSLKSPGEFGVLAWGFRNNCAVWMGILPLMLRGGTKNPQGLEIH